MGESFLDSKEPRGRGAPVAEGGAGRRRSRASVSASRRPESRAEARPDVARRRPARRRTPPPTNQSGWPPGPAGPLANDGVRSIWIQFDLRSGLVDIGRFHPLKKKTSMPKIENEIDSHGHTNGPIRLGYTWLIEVQIQYDVKKTIFPSYLYDFYSRRLVFYYRCLSFITDL